LGLSSSSTPRHHAHKHTVGAKGTFIAAGSQGGSMSRQMNVKRNPLPPAIGTLKQRAPRLSWRQTAPTLATAQPPGQRSNGVSIAAQNVIGTVKFIRSQKKCAQLVYRDYIYNRKTVHQNGRTTWRCSELIKYHCKATCVTKLNKLISTRCEHNHVDHSVKIESKTLYDFPEDLEEYLNIRTRDPLDFKNHELDVIDTGAEFRIVLRDHHLSESRQPSIIVERETTEMDLLDAPVDEDEQDKL
uniref:FLYWCH-type domain-containing protein n=1 Tax=Anopheles maculatus TaxID=74869 RepID=A0A182SQZ3_9DIPT